ncbi:MFS transporter [bacterium]|nr:MFS transporter [bacterium]
MSASAVVGVVNAESEPRSLAEDDASRVLGRNLGASVGDAGAFGVMVGVGETYIPAFVLALGLGDVFAGLVTTIPLLMGSLLQLIGPWAVHRLQSHRRWVVLCAAIQGLCFLPLIAAALAGSIPGLLVMAISSVYWGSGLATGPAWNTWQGTLIPRSIRANFFARRSRLQQMATLGGFLLGGFSLQAARAEGWVVPMFAMLFTVACTCRLLSTFCLWLQSEPVPMPAGIAPFEWRHAIERCLHGPTGPLLLLAVSMQAGVYVAGPFFNPYMLKVLEFSYAGYAILLGTSFVAKFMLLPLWGRYAHRHGAQSLLWIGVFGIIPLSMGWVFSDDYTWLVILQVISGAAWGAYELALMLLFFETIPERDRTNILTVYNVANSVALVIGSTIGAALLKWGNVTQEAYLWAFGVSMFVRMSSLIWLVRLPRITVQATETVIRPLTMRPSSGSIDDPVLTTMKDIEEAA